MLSDVLGADATVHYHLLTFAGWRAASPLRDAMVQPSARPFAELLGDVGLDELGGGHAL
ncbi:hypothetical protein AB0945_38530 [Streptomyces sp. NPDC005474]|uniref:hypothetical protein n=1 Tax=Streptomyces sp. NPDC005474 TaxID=3154878 RepID=UPI0034521A2C